MLALVGGIVALVLGLLLLREWWQSFLHILQGSIPLLLIFGGGLATYLGVEEMRERLETARDIGGSDALEHYRAETERLREETAALRREMARLKGESCQ